MSVSERDPVEGRKAAVVVGLAALVGLSVAGVVTVREGVEDELTARGAAVLSEAGIDGVQVQLAGRDVELVGTVDDAAQAARAAELVAAETGVRVVDNGRLEVVGQATDASDDGSGPDGELAVSDGDDETGAEGTEPPATDAGTEAAADETTEDTASDVTASDVDDGSSGDTEGQAEEDEDASGDDSGGDDTADDEPEGTEPTEGGGEPVFEVMSAAGGLRVDGVVGNDADRQALLGAARAAAGETGVDDRLEVQQGVDALGGRTGPIEPLVGWVVASAGAPARDGVGFEVRGPDVQFFGSVGGSAWVQAQAAAPAALGRDGLLDLGTLLVMGRSPVAMEGEVGSIDLDELERVGERVLFAYSATALDAEARAIVDGIADELEERGVTEVVITGHTDVTGTIAGNIDLSLERARAVRAALRERLPGLSVVIGGCGETMPLDDPAHSRRAEVLVAS